MFGELYGWWSYLRGLRRVTTRPARKSPRRKVVLDVERLESRQLLSSDIREYVTPTGFAGPMGITAGGDGKLWFAESAVSKVGKMSLAGVGNDYTVGTGYSPQFIATASPGTNVWFTEPATALSNYVGTSTNTGTVTQYFIDRAVRVFHQITGITQASDGNFWFTEVVDASPTSYVGKVGMITPSGSVSLYTVVTKTSAFSLGGIAEGDDHNLWFTEYTDNKIGVISKTGTLINQYAVPTGNSHPYGITAGPDHALWFTEETGNKIGRISLGGGISEFNVPTANSEPHGITRGPDNNIWFTEYTGNKIGFLNPADTSHAPSEFAVPTANSGPEGITSAGGTIWFTENSASQIGEVLWLLSGVAPANDPNQGFVIPVGGGQGGMNFGGFGGLNGLGNLFHGLGNGPSGGGPGSGLGGLGSNSSGGGIGSGVQGQQPPPGFAQLQPGALPGLVLNWPAGGQQKGFPPLSPDPSWLSGGWSPGSSNGVIPPTAPGPDPLPWPMSTGLPPPLGGGNPSNPPGFPPGTDPTNPGGGSGNTGGLTYDATLMALVAPQDGDLQVGHALDFRRSPDLPP
jgi:virginiamycin B lyase